MFNQISYINNLKSWKIKVIKNKDSPSKQAYIIVFLERLIMNLRIFIHIFVPSPFSDKWLTFVKWHCSITSRTMPDCTETMREELASKSDNIMVNSGKLDRQPKITRKFKRQWKRWPREDPRMENQTMHSRRWKTGTEEAPQSRSKLFLNSHPHKVLKVPVQTKLRGTASGKQQSSCIIMQRLTCYLGTIGTLHYSLISSRWKEEHELEFSFLGLIWIFFVSSSPWRVCLFVHLGIKWDNVFNMPRKNLA